MGEIKPLGSEKLSSNDKLKRIIELTYYKNSPNKEELNENIVNTPEYIVKGNNGSFYGIVKEKNDYYVKKSLTESNLDYIGGMFMKNKNRFNSYSEALKRLELLKGQEELQEATKYVLKKPAPTTPPVSDEPLPDETMGEPTDEPIDDPTTMSDDNSDESSQEEGEGKRSDYMAEIQKFSGKLGQELRDQKEKMESDDIKYVLNMIISAVDLTKLDENDLDDVVKNFDFDNSEESDEEPSVDSDNEDEGDLSETDDHGFNELEKFVKTPFEKEDEMEEIDLSDYADLNEDGDDDVEEIDLQKIMDEINNTTGQVLSKYFK